MITAPEQTSWLFRITVDDRPGIMAAIATAFSRRGIQVQCFFGYGAPVTLGDEVEGTIFVGFRAYDYRMASMERVLARLEHVRRVEVDNLATTDRLLKIATARVSGPEGELLVLAERGGVSAHSLRRPGQPPTLLLSGTPTAVDRVLHLLGEMGQLHDSHYSLTPLPD